MPPLHIAATCFRMNLWFKSIGHASLHIEFFIPTCVRPQMATPTDLPSASMIVHAPIAVLHPEFLAACSVSALSLSKVVASWMATKSAWVLEVLLGPRPCIRIARIKGPQSLEQCCLLITDREPSSAHVRSSGPFSVGFLLVSLSLAAPGVVFGESSFASLGVASKSSLISSFSGVQLSIGRISGANSSRELSAATVRCLQQSCRTIGDRC